MFTTLQPTTSTLFPYTTLFRSFRGAGPSARGAQANAPQHGAFHQEVDRLQQQRNQQPERPGAVVRAHPGERSEEHTSELQSPCNLVCRLLLEKKKSHYNTLEDT